MNIWGLFLVFPFSVVSFWVIRFPWLVGSWNALASQMSRRWNRKVNYLEKEADGRMDVCNVCTYGYERLLVLRKPIFATSSIPPPLFFCVCGRGVSIVFMVIRYSPYGRHIGGAIMMVMKRVIGDGDEKCCNR